MQYNREFFYKAAKIHSDIFNRFVDTVRQKLSTLGHRQILAKTQNRENDG